MDDNYYQDTSMVDEDEELYSLPVGVGVGGVARKKPGFMDRLKEALRKQYQTQPSVTQMSQGGVMPQEQDQSMKTAQNLGEIGGSLFKIFGGGG